MSVYDVDSELDEAGLYKSASEAYSQDVVPRARGIQPPSAEDIPSIISPGPKIKFDPLKGDSFKFDLFAAKPAPAADGPTATPGKSDSFRFNLFPDEPAAAAPEPKKLGFLESTGKKIDDTITKIAGSNKPKDEQIDKLGLAEFKIQEAQDRVLVAQRRAELGTGKDRNYGMQLFDSAAADLGNAVSSVLGFIGEKTGSSALSSLAEAGKREADALRPEQQDIVQKVAGALGSLTAFAVPGAGIAGGLRLLGAGIGAARTAGAGTAALLESASIGQETFEKALSETGNRQLANEQAWKAAAINLPINWFTNKIGIFTDKGSAARQIGMTMLAEGGEEGAQTLLTNTLGFKPVGEGFSESVAIGAIAGGALKGGSVALENYFKEATPEQQDMLVKSLIEDGQQARQKIFDEMVKDERTAQAFAAQGIESAADPRFQEAAIRIVKLNRQLSEIEAVDAKTRDEKTKARRSDVEAAFGDTASTSVGVGTGADTPVIQRSSVNIGADGASLVPATSLGVQPVKLQDGTTAMSGEDIVANEQGFKVLPAFTTADGVRGNTFATTNMAETFLYGPFDKKANKRSGGWADQQDGSSVYQIRQGQRSKANGGGKFYFIEGKKADTAVPAKNSAGFVTEPASQVQAQVDAVNDGRKQAVVTGTQEAASINADGLASTTVTDKSTGEQSVVISKDPAVGTQAQQRTDEVGLKQAMGETLGVVNPTATATPQANDVVVQQKDNQSGEVIAEELVAPESVAQVVKVPETTTTITTPVAAVGGRAEKPAPIYSEMSYDELEAALAAGYATNEALDIAAIRKYLGNEAAETYGAIRMRLSKDKWWMNNTTDAMDMESSIGPNGVDVDLIQEYRDAFYDFDTESAELLGESIAFKTKDLEIGKPGYTNSPAYVTVRNAFAYAKEQGWSEADVMKGMRRRAVRLAGDDAPELYSRLFRSIEPKNTAAPAKSSPEAEAQKALAPAAATTTAPAAPPQASKPPAKKKKGGVNLRAALMESNPFRAFLGRVGISTKLAKNFVPGITEQRKFMAMGYGPIFRRLGLELGDIQVRAVELGFLPRSDMESGDSAISELIQNSVDGAKIFPEYGIDSEDVMIRRFAEQNQRELEDAEAAAASEDEPVSQVAAEASDEHVFEADDAYDAMLEGVSFDGTPSNTVIDTRADMEAMGFTEEEILYELARENTNREAQAVPQAENPAAGREVEAGQSRADEARPGDAASPAAEVKPVESAPPVKQTVEVKLKEKQKAKKAKAEKKPELVAPDVKPDESTKAKTQKKADTNLAPAPENKQAVREEAIENWEDNDGGDGLHIAFNDLPKEFQSDWLNAYAPRDGGKPYASAALHDEYVARVKNNERKERINAKVAANKAKDTPIDGAFRISGGKRGGMTVDRVLNILKEATKGWTNVPKVNIVPSEKDLPTELQQNINRANAQGVVPGIFYNGEVYLVASSLNDADDVILTVTHEIAGHYGLRSILGQRYADVMQNIYKGNAYVRGLADKMMVKEGLDQNTAVEEVLADLAENNAADLSDAKQAKSALAEIYSAIRKWLRETFNIAYATDAEIKQIVKAARRYVVDGEARAVEVQALNNVAMRMNGAPTFYSALQRGFQSAKMESMPAAQWKQWLQSNQGKLGIKSEEIEWVGINDWLDLQQGKVSKQSVLDFIGGNQVQLNDVILSGRGVYVSDADLRALYQDTLGDEMTNDPIYMSRDELLNELGIYSENQSGTKHAGLTLPGGKEYMELVVLDPTKRTARYKLNDEIHFGDIGDGRTIGWLRMTERENANGETVLFIEELQSQRAQDRRDDPTVPDAPLTRDTKAWTALLLKKAIAYAQRSGIQQIAWTTGTQQNDRYKLSDKLDHIEYFSRNDGTYDILAIKDGRAFNRRFTIQGQKVTTSGTKSLKEIESLFGKGIADQVEKGAGRNEDGTMILEGDDLNAGGQGMRDYYDKIVPSVAGSIIKQFGGQVSAIKIGENEQQSFTITAKLAETVATDGLPLFRRKDYEDQFKDVSPRVREMAVAKGYYSPPTIKERLDSLKPRLWLRVVQGTFDQFRSVRDLGLKEYMLLRMSSGGQSGGLTTLLHFGQVFDDGGALNVKPNTEGLLDILKPVGIETDRFLLWIAANRAGELSKQDRELFFSPEEITELKKLNAGTMPGGGSRAAVYAKTLQKMNALNKSVLDVALSTGLIDKAGYDKFVADIWYVPFYRQMEDDNTLGAAQTATGSVGQYLSKNLKGSKRQLNDLMENVLLNWNHILSASMKNQAAVATLHTASDLGQIVTKLDKQEKGAVKVMEQGKETFYRIDDEFLLASLESVASIPTYGPIIQAGRYAKTMLTRFISLSPTFKINNLIRDSIQSIAVSGLKKNPVANVIEGWAAYRDNRAEALAGGGLFAMGNAFDGDQSATVKRLLKTGASADSVLSTTEKAKAWITKAQLKYDEISDSLENSSRIALYQQMRQSGSSHLEASFAARDLQDFSLQGSFSAIRYANLLLPYFNARLQGLYKLGHDGIDPVVAVLSGKGTSTQRQKAGKFAAVLGAVTLVELMLYLSQMDDDEWKKREEWDKDAFWWFKFPGTDKAIRIPKPFEMGAFATIVGRATEQMVDKDVEGKLFAKRLGAVLHDNLAINPMPQIFRPLYDIAKNKDGFTDRPIESMGMERLSPELRINQGTSAAAVGLSKVNGLIASAADTLTGGAIKKEEAQFSPIQYDYLVRGYLGWVGTAVQTSANLAVQPFKEGSSSRFERIDDYLLVGNYLKTVPASQSKYVTSFYENAKASAMAVSDMQHFINAGQIDRAREVFEKEGDKIALSKLYTKSAARMADISKQMRFIEDDTQMSGSDKRLELERLSQIRVEYARRVEEVRIARKN